MKKAILCAMVLMPLTAWGYAQETQGATVQPTAASTPNPTVTTPPTPTAVPAPSTPRARPAAGPWYLSLGLGDDFPAQNWIRAYIVGGGGQVAMGYQLSEEWAVELDLDDFLFSGTSITTGAVSDFELRVLPTARYTFRTGSDIRPYVLAGSGIDLQFLTGPAGGELAKSFDMAAGLGVEWKVEPESFLFAQGKWDLLAAAGPHNTTVSEQDVPVMAGVRWGL